MEPNCVCHHKNSFLDHCHLGKVSPGAIISVVDGTRLKWTVGGFLVRDREISIKLNGGNRTSGHHCLIDSLVYVSAMPTDCCRFFCFLSLSHSHTRRTQSPSRRKFAFCCVNLKGLACNHPRK